RSQEPRVRSREPAIRSRSFPTELLIHLSPDSRLQAPVSSLPTPGARLRSQVSRLRASAISNKRAVCLRVVLQTFHLSPQSCYRKKRGFEYRILQNQVSYSYQHDLL